MRHTTRAVLTLAATMSTVAALGVGLTAAAPASAATATYTVTDLGSLGGGVTHGLAINALGQVTGDSTLAKTIMEPCEFPQSPNQKTCHVNLDHAFFWSNGTMTDLGTLGGINSEGVALNDSGEVIGSSEQLKTGVSEFPFLFSGNDQKLTALGMVSALGINDSGQIAGECVVAGFGAACLVSSNGTVTQLGESVPPENSTQIACGEAVAVNNNGQALAFCEGEGIGAPFSGKAAVLWTNGTPTVVGPITDSTVPIGLNNNGQIVANAEDTATGQTHALLLTPS